MPFKDKTLQREAAAAGMRRHRQYQKALAAGHPLALAAEATRRTNHMKPFHELDKRLAALPSNAAREPYRAEHTALRAKCQSDRDAAPARYLELRAQLFAALAAVNAAPLAPAVDPFS